MWRYLNPRFWSLLGLFFLTAVVLHRGQDFFRRPAATLVAMDEVSSRAAKAETPSAQTGLLPGTEARLNAYLDSFIPSADGHDWRFLHQEWLELARQWFERVAPGQGGYERYVLLWLQKREDMRQWRQDCRREFYPDLDDGELEARAEWLREQDEWKEMQEKIRSGIAKLEAAHEASLDGLLGEGRGSFLRLHSLFLVEQLPRDAAPNLFFL